MVYRISFFYGAFQKLDRTETLDHAWPKCSLAEASSIHAANGSSAGDGQFRLPMWLTAAELAPLKFLTVCCSLQGAHRSLTAKWTRGAGLISVRVRLEQ